MRKNKIGSALRGSGPVCAAAAFALLGATGASAAYFGSAYVQVPGVPGVGKIPAYSKWVKTEGHYWKGGSGMGLGLRGGGGAYNGLKFTTSTAPTKGPNTLNIAIDKRSPSFKPLMDKCAKGGSIPEIVFAESAELVRHSQEYGPRPADIPEFYEYALKDVTIACPVAQGAPEQPFQLSFQSIEWRNFKPETGPRDLSKTAKPATLPPAPSTGTAKTFVISWYANITDSSADQCPQMNKKPSEADYYALMTPERAAEQRAALVKKGGVSVGELPFRGPAEMNVINLPGIVPDPGHFAPQVDVVRGFNLDGDDGTGPTPKNTTKHKNFTAPWGEKGVDNQLFAIAGCIEGYRRNGFMPLIANDQRRAGLLSLMVEISGIDNERNDDDVAVTIFYSNDPMKRDGTSKVILPDYTYSLSTSTEYSSDFVRFRGKLVNGVITTESVPQLLLHEGQASGTPLFQARMRLEIKPNGNLEAVVGGYRDWRRYMNFATAMGSNYENTIGFQVPGLYDAIKRAADGMKDPVTGEFNGISAAFEMEGVPAFLPPAQQQKLALGQLAEK